MHTMASVTLSYTHKINNIYFLNVLNQNGELVGHMSLVPVFRKQSRRISEFQASLVYRLSSRRSRVTQRNNISKTKQNKTP